MKSAIQEAVNQAHKQGFAPLAISPTSKKPKVSAWEHWQHRRPTSEELRQMFRGESNLAVICGAVSGGLSVLDVDNLALADAMSGDIGLQYETTMVRTPRGGLHVYAIETEAATACQPIAGVGDLKGNGGYVLTPPSSIPEVGEYTMLTNGTIKVVPNAREWFVEILSAFDVQVPVQDKREPVDTAEVLEGIAEGERDATLFRLACKLRRADVPRETAERLVLEAAANCRPPFADRDALAKVASAYSRYAPAEDITSHVGFGDSVSALTSPENWPADLAPAAFYGLPGVIVGVLGPHTEADPVSILLPVLVGFGNAAGDGAFYPVNGHHHPARLNALMVGSTSKGRKGVGQAEAERVLRLGDPRWGDSNIVSGLSSGEGLIWACRDPIFRREAIKEKGKVVGYQEVQVDEGVADKRLMVVEAEFGRTLRVAGRDGNVLSAVVRQGWDSGNLRIMTRANPVRSTGAHVSVMGQITRDELLRELSSTDAANGFGNRFIVQVVRRSKLLPDGGSAPDCQIQDLGARVAEALQFASAAGRMERDQAARDLWHSVYPTLSAERPGLFGAMTARAEAQVLRLSMVYALMDLSRSIRQEHLEAALAVWERAEATVRYLFGDLTGDPIADTILRALRAQGELSQSAISGLFGRNVPAERIGRATAVLVDAGLIGSERIETSGRTITMWRAK